MSNTTEQVASIPFNDSGADVILQTCDNVNFRVFRAILSVASPVFKDMFTLPQPQPDSEASHDTIPVVIVSEDSLTLDTLLRFCYPMDYPVIEFKEVLIATLMAAQKYDMGFAFKRIVDIFYTPSKIKAAPVEAYAIGCRFRLENLARAAAKESLRLPLDRLLSPGDSTNTELGYISGTDYQRLIRYYRACRTSCKKLTASDPYDLTWIPNVLAYSFHVHRCRLSTGSDMVRAILTPDGRVVDLLRLKWWFHYLDRTTRAYSRVGPSAVTLPDIQVAMAEAQSTGCPTCLLDARKDLDRFATAYKQKIASCLSSVSGTISSELVRH
ncbi:hypothetical protein ONZ45_g5092 [Pleurotus djamor]|nr:hypothetical protein ONZ45_g5092 [Pleurotus djamor]